MTDAKCPKCGSYHDTVHGFREHHDAAHGYWPRYSITEKAKALAEEGPNAA